MDEEDILQQIYTLDMTKSHDESRKYDQKEVEKQLKDLGRGGRPKKEGVTNIGDHQWDLHKKKQILAI